MNVRCVLMPRVVLTLFALFVALGCGASGPGVTARAKTAPPPPRAAVPKVPAQPLAEPGCAEEPLPGNPELCIPDGGTEQFVVGLTQEHGWERGDWVTVNVGQPGVTHMLPIALAVVVEPYRDVARVSVLYQRGERGLDGGRVRRVGKEERARLGKFVGRIARVEAGRVQLDVGAKDDAHADDIYEIRSARDSSRSIARVRVSELGDLHLWAAPLDQSEPLHEGLIAVYLRSREPSNGKQRPVSIVVASFAPTHEQDEEEAKAAEVYSKELANVLTSAAAGLQGVSVRYEGNERVKLVGSDAAAHAEARSLGKRHAADIVVWGSMRCSDRASEKACAQPRFTVVSPTPSQKRNEKEASDGANVTLDGAASADPPVVAAAILGSAAFAAGRYADASYYLHQAVGEKTFGAEDELRARRNLSHALASRRQTAAARRQANTLLKRARALHKKDWEQLGQRELARIDQQEGRVAEQERPWQRPVGIVAMGVGVAGLGAGAVLGWLAMEKNGDSNDGHCNAADRCDATGVALRHEAVGLGKASTVAMTAGGALLGAGAVLFLTAPSLGAAPERTGAKTGLRSARFEILPGGVQVRGAW